MTVSSPILIGVGANLTSERFGSPLQACEAAVRDLDALAGISVVARSRWFESAPVPLSDQPWFVNGVVQITCLMMAPALLDALHAVEARFGRVRTVANAPRVLDLDLLAFGDEILGKPGEGGFQVPHPRLQDRAFVLLPLEDVAPEWVHPKTGATLAEMIAKLPQDQVCRPLEGQE